ncbi:MULTISPECIES: MCE family protein [Mycobacterium]|jgi:phospholipid/cholesterol/gamma-HCH transport system substrate-binding protein|uniref:Virulence factor n=6 Tax=Mycobacterium TaxID=1763 RepID=A0A7I9ZDJ3_9MYCO|nr:MULTISPECIES: MCE family protein [Mycobacterium]ASW94627.1 MCE-family protein MCE3A [Mycobacterium intracellulare]MCA2231215.1 MCE family protein [Mycobacterium intracellulare]MCA2248490.1 MCE family protein [Mycobacterium intracellulare]MCA2262898.1 MCE family protein [Mycobacterium marseillense]MCA2355465.1 MCE family protein [Mycobacterium intracellulare]
MKPSSSADDAHLGRWATISCGVIVALITLATALFNGTFRSFVPLTLTSDRSGLVMEPGGKVMLRGVQVGRVASVTGGTEPVSLQLEIDPDQVRNIPANIEAQIKASTLFGSKYVDLVYPENPSTKHIAAGALLRSRNVSTEVNTVFQNLALVLKQIDPAKLNATLTAWAIGLRGEGQTIGQAITDANQVLLALNPRMGTVQQDLRSLSGFSDAYSAAGQDILRTLAAVSTTSATVTSHTSALDALLLNAIGLSQSGTDLIAPNQSNFVRGINLLEPTTNLLMKYNPEYTCMLLGATWYVDNGGRDALGGSNGYSMIVDAALLLGDDPYKYPQNLPIVAAKGGPGGKPSCGSLPDPSKNYPVRQLITDTGWGTGLDIRPNPGIGHPCYADYLPVTRAVPQPPSIRECIPGPAPGPIPYSGAPPYGAAQYGPDGTPLNPPPPGPQHSPSDTSGTHP